LEFFIQNVGEEIYNGGLPCDEKSLTILTVEELVCSQTDGQTI